MGEYIQPKSVFRLKLSIEEHFLTEKGTIREIYQEKVFDDESEKLCRLLAYMLRGTIYDFMVSLPTRVVCGQYQKKEDE